MLLKIHKNKESVVDNTTLNFLKGKLADVKKRIAASKDYREMKLLEEMIVELEPPIKEEPNALVIYPKDLPQDKKKIRVNYNRDTDNSPLVSIPYGTRVMFIYNAVEKIIKDNGGSIEIDLIEEFLKDKHGIAFTAYKNLASYIKCYNTNPATMDDKTLELCGAKIGPSGRITKYTVIKYVGKERLPGKI